MHFLWIVKNKTKKKCWNYIHKEKLLIKSVVKWSKVNNIFANGLEKLSKNKSIGVGTKTKSKRLTRSLWRNNKQEDNPLWQKIKKGIIMWGEDLLRKDNKIIQWKQKRGCFDNTIFKAAGTSLILLCWWKFLFQLLRDGYRKIKNRDSWIVICRIKNWKKYFWIISKWEA